MNKDVKAKIVAGVYKSKKTAVEKRESSINSVELTAKAKTCTKKLQLIPNNPHGSMDNHRLASKDVPMRELKQSLRPPIILC